MTETSICGSCDSLSCHHCKSIAKATFRFPYVDYVHLLSLRETIYVSCAAHCCQFLLFPAIWRVCDHLAHDDRDHVCVAVVLHARTAIASAFMWHSAGVRGLLISTTAARNGRARKMMLLPPAIITSTVRRPLSPAFSRHYWALGQSSQCVMH